MAGAGAGAGAAPSRRPVIGDRVMLSPEFAIHGDAGVVLCASYLSHVARLRGMLPVAYCVRLLGSHAHAHVWTHTHPSTVCRSPCTRASMGCFTPPPSPLPCCSQRVALCVQATLAPWTRTTAVSSPSKSGPQMGGRGGTGRLPLSSLPTQAWCVPFPFAHVPKAAFFFLYGLTP